MPQAEVTVLAPAQERQFRAWAHANHVTDVDAPESHYDYRGYWKDVAAKGGDQRRSYADGPHFPDTYKQHGHPTFSIESQYSTGPTDGGRWEGEQFVPPPSPPAPALGEDVTARMPAIGEDVTALMGDAAPPTAAPDLERRKDSNVIGIDYDWIANKASQLPEAMRKPVAAATAFLAHVLESSSAPESVATLGLARVPSVTPPAGYVPPPLPRPSAHQVGRAAVGAVKLALAPGTGLVKGFGEGVANAAFKGIKKFAADEFLKHVEALAAARAADPVVEAAIPTAVARAPIAAPVVTPPTVPPPVAARVAVPARPPITVTDLPASWKQFLTPVEPGPAFKVSDPLPTAAPRPAAAPIAKVVQAVQTVATAKKLKLTGEEMRAAMDLVKGGMPAADALQAIVTQRAFLGSLKGALPTAAEAKAAIAKRKYKS